MFQLKKYGSDVSTEFMAGLTTFFAMSYILLVNPSVLASSGVPWGGVYLATIFASIIGTLVMGLFANVPYAVAPGMGLNAFFTYTVVMQLGFTWQQALSLVFICGLINILITVTKVRKLLIEAIPDSLQSAIGAGIGMFVAYIGFKNAGLFQFLLDPGTYTMAGETVIGSSAAVPGLTAFKDPGILLSLIALALTIILVVKNVKGAILIGIAVSTVLAFPLGVIDASTIAANQISLSEAFDQLGQTAFTIFKPEGLPSLFSDPARIPLVLMTIFAFSITDTFDTIGTFIGTGRSAGIFTDEEIQKMSNEAGFSTRLDKALFADSIATSVGAIFGTSNTTTFVESAAGIGAGGRTGLTSVFTAMMFALCIFITPIASIVPAQATSAALVIVGVMMVSSLSDVNWSDMEEAIPAFFSSVFMALCYSISYGIAFGFFAYILVKCARGKAKEIKPLLWICAGLFILNFILQANL